MELEDMGFPSDSAALQQRISLKPSQELELSSVKCQHQGREVAC